MSRECNLRCRFRCLVIRVAVVISIPLLGAAQTQAGWEREMLSELYLKYLGESPDSGNPEAVERLARSVGELLMKGGASAVPAEDLALFALLQAKSEGACSDGALATVSAVEPDTTSENDDDEEELQTVSKGDEGIVRGLERLAEMPLTERMVITGDVTSGIQAATLPGAPTLTTTLGRMRMNVVARTLPRTTIGAWGEGSFFLQMIAAGGAPDGGPLGGPVSFSAFNDIATDRSSSNEFPARGNIYLAKALYRQTVNLGQNRFTAHAGVLDMSDYFDTNVFANNEARQFMNSSLVNSPGYKTGIIAPGLVGEYFMKSDREWLQQIVVRGGYSVSNTFRAFTSPIWSGEIELRTLLGGQRGHWRLGGTVGHVAGVGSVNIIHTSIDHWLSPRSGIFGRYALATAGPGSLAFGPVRQSYGGGFQLILVDEDDRMSAWGVGLSQSFPVETSERQASERVLETFYRWQVGRNFSLTPDLQLILGSGGKRQKGTHGVFGMRVNYIF